MKKIILIISFTLFAMSLATQLNAQDNPTAVIYVGNNTVCLGDVVQFTDQSFDPMLHPIVSWYWDFGDGVTSTEQHPIHIFSTPGLFSVLLTVYNDVGGSNTTQIPLTVTDVNVSFNTENVLCFGESDGAIQATPSGGTAPYQYLWNNDLTEDIISDLSAGVYHLTVTDANGCTAGASESLAQPDALNVIISNITNISCFGASDGAIQVTIFGGTAPYYYQWNNGSTLPFVSGLSAGVYTITVTDANGCTAFTNVSLTQPAPLNVDVISSGCVDSTGFGWVGSSVSGGTPPYSYNWNYPFIGFYQIVSPGTYTVTVVDINGCVAIDGILLDDNLCNINVAGKVYNDLNANCICDESEAIAHALVRAMPGNYYSYTDHDGNYDFFLNAGSYIIDVANLPYHEISCPEQGFQTVVITDIYDTISNVDIGLEALVVCGIPYVNISTGNIRPCFNASISVNYGISGTVASENNYIEIELDPIQTYVSSTIPYDSFDGNTYTFFIGDLSPFIINNFQIDVYNECDLSLLGTTACINALIYPNDPCETDFGDWDHSSLSVEGHCENDLNACFTITNTGDFGDGDMLNVHEYRIFANDTLVFYGNFQLDGGEVLDVCWPTNGRAIRLEADQHPEHPGNSHPQETVEDCGDLLGTSLGFITNNSYDDEDSFVDIYCRMVTSSYDPNEKLVHPTGITSNHYIDNDLTLTYQINFQNTGTDTAFTVVITDTISNVHDMATFQNGVSSHPCELQITGQGILKWTFNDILLPDSTTNEPESHGFVTYTIKPVEMTEEDYGTQILNTAAIFFDFNPPVITNTTQLMFWNLPIVQLANLPVNSAGFSVKLYPNPAREILFVESTSTICEYSLFDISGKKVKNGKRTRDVFEINLKGLKPGIYIINLKDKLGNQTIERIVIE